jgi:hypothetical protein
MWSADTAWPDQWVLIGPMAAVTSRLKLSINSSVTSRDIPRYIDLTDTMPNGESFSASSVCYTI